MKKAIIAVGSVLAVFIIVFTVYFIINKDRSEQVDNIDTELTPTESPTEAPTPTITPDPEDISEAVALYPAFQKIDGEEKYGYIDKSGTFVINPVYDYAEPYTDGMAIVRSVGNYKVIDKTGAIIFENNDNIILPYHNGMAAFMNIKEDTLLYGYIDTKGTVIIEPSFTFADNFNEDGQAYVALPGGKGYQLIDKTGKVLESYEVDLGNGYTYAFENGYILYSNSDTMKYGVKKVDGTDLFEAKYSSIAYLGHDLFAVKSPEIEPYEAMFDPFALYNASGEQLTDYILYDVQHFTGDYTSAANDSYVYFMDTKGQEITTLPSFEGGGNLTLLGDIVKAEIDGVLSYYRLDNTALWQEDTTTYLENGITVKELKFKPLRSVMVRYPVVEGLADPGIQKEINEQLETIFTESRANITLEDGLSVEDTFQASLAKNLLTITMSGYDYFEGAAHGMPLKEYYFIDINTGEFFDLKDLFIKGSDYKTMIDEFIRTKMAEADPEESMYFPDTFTGISDAQYFYLSENGLVIYFYPYEITAFAAGFPEFEISFEELKDYLNTDGSFWKSFH
ncbi:MAG: repeat-containing protein [Herbinix sp.]|jgi:hypothetical protein|nr:repeat-containing protein [Herbinix sp.]